MGLEYHNEVKNSFHLKIIICIRKKKFGSSEIWTPVLWTKGQSWTHITSQPLHNFFSKTSKVIMQSKLFMAGFKNSKIVRFEAGFWNFFDNKKSKNYEIFLIWNWSNSILICRHFCFLLLLSVSYLHSLVHIA